MERRLNIVFLATIGISVLFQSSSAQRDHIVGDALGWVIPPGSSVYTTWAANKAFRVGDTLVFNFPNGAHDVSKVTRANYDSCNAQNSILMLSSSPANVTLNETGSHYFICGFPSHCGAGQKLSMTVIAAGSTSSPAPQPSTAAPQPDPLPSEPTPALQVGPTPSPSPSSSSPAPSPSTATPPSSSLSPSPSIASPPSSPDSSLSPTTPSPAGDNNNATPPTPGSSATSLGVAGLTATFLSLIVTFFM